MTRPTPTPRQIAFHTWERGLFLHFGLRTFYEGWRDFDPRPIDPVRFDPLDVDCDQWAQVASEAGFRYMILTAKHHDGFANWPSKTTGYSVAQSPWRGGKGDVIRDFADACQRHGLKVGLYYSPFDASSPVYADSRAYDDYFVAQISELLLPYGPIDILWFDGCGSEGHQYDWSRIVAEIRGMQPDILIFNMGDPDIRWIGSEDGYAPLTTRNVVDHVPFSVNAGDSEIPERRWLCPECNSRMRDRNWFFSDQDEHTIKSLDELMGMYDYSCGRGCNMLINIGPDRRGLLPDADAARLIEFGKALQRRFSSPCATLADFARQGDSWAFESSPYTPIDCVVVGEDIARGESITRFAIKAQPEHGRVAITLYEGHAVGCRAICRFPTFRARRVWLDVLASEGDVFLSRLKLYHTHAK